MKKHLLLLSVLCFLPQLACACTVCFGGADSNLIRGFTWGVAILALLPFTLMAGLFGLITYQIKKNKRHE